MSKKKPKGYYGFAHTLTDEKRREKYRKQRERQGFDDTETWDLGLTTFPEFMLPRLKRFKVLHNRRLVSDPEFDAQMDQAIEALRVMKDDDYKFSKGLQAHKAEVLKAHEGMHAFADIVMRLWW